MQDHCISYPPSLKRRNPQPNGFDLLDRFFFEPELGVCCITRLGSVLQNKLPSRAHTIVPNTNKPIALGSHHTLYYQCANTAEEFFSSVDDVAQWIQSGPILQPPLLSQQSNNNHVSSPPCAVPREHATHTQQDRSVPVPLGNDTASVSTGIICAFPPADTVPNRLDSLAGWGQYEFRPHRITYPQY